MRIINVPLISHPLNWVIVLVMVVVGVMVVNLLLTPWHSPLQPKSL